MVTIRKPFYIGKYQVRRDEYAALMGKEAENDPFSFVRMTESPAEPALAKYEAVRDELMPLMQKKLPKNWTVRLPTEDEWEHATRAGTATLWYSGDTEADLAEIGWYGANAMDTLQPVGQLKPNAWGLYDMVGNAWHYVFRKDGWYNDTDKEAHIVRGGDCQSPAFGNGCRTSNYMISSVTAGYRFALDPP
jgi:formylglycine-generating enzyme required for sulfatase activity